MAISLALSAYALSGSSFAFEDAVMDAAATGETAAADTSPLQPATPLAATPSDAAPDSLWLRAYATGGIGDEARFFLPDYYETEAETIVRDEIAGFLAARNADVSSSDETGLRISYSVKVDRPPAKGLPQSPLRLEPERTRNRNPAAVDVNTVESGVRPALALGPRFERTAPETSVRVTVYVLKDGARLWSGYAQSGLDGVSVSDRARSLAALLTTYWGVDASLNGGAGEGAPH